MAAFDHSQKKIYLYIHVGAINNWLEVLNEIIERTIMSGMYDVLSQIRIGFLGDDIQLKTLRDYIINIPKIAIHVFSTDLRVYERLTLHRMRQDSVDDEFYAMYCHTKGVSKYNTPCYNKVRDWIKYMHYFTISKYEKMIELLSGDCDTVGCNIAPVEPLHYSGNIWWTRSSYLRKLTPVIGNNYIDPEMWILSENGKFAEIHNSSDKVPGINHYENFYPIKYYINETLENIKTIEVRDHDTVKILFGANFWYSDVTSKLKPFITDNIISFKAGDITLELLGDPLFGQVKTLYLCYKGRYETLNESDIFTSDVTIKFP